MRLFLLILLVLIISLSATWAPAQPPAFTYCRLAEPNDTSASRAHVVAVDDSGTVLVGGEVRVGSVMRAVSLVSGIVDDYTRADIYEMPTPDPSVASRVNCIATPKGQTWMLPWCAGSWALDAAGDPLPGVWHDSTVNDSMDFEYVLLPTLGGAGTGVVMATGIVDGVDGAVFGLCGWSASVGGVKHAVAWTADSAQGPYSIELMGDYGPSYPSQANDVLAREDSTLLAVGWAETPGGLTMPQRWWRDQQGTWTRALMPLPVGAVEGGVNSILGQQGNEVMTAAGWCIDSFDEKHAALWTKEEESPWVAEDLGTLVGYDESNGLGAAILGQQGNEIYVAGTSYTGEDSVATLWILGQQGNEIYDLNDLVVNEDSLDLSLRIATGIDAGGPESLFVLTGWGVEMGGMSPLTSPADPHSFLLIEETASASVRGKDLTPVSLKLATSPNPFSSGVRVSYTLPHRGRVTLTVHDVLGRRVATLADGFQAAGEQSQIWSGLDSKGRQEAPGVYFMRLAFGEEVHTRKAILLQ